MFKKIFAHQLKPTIIVIWATYIKLVAYHHCTNGFQECLNGNKRVTFFISHTDVWKFLCRTFECAI